MKIIARTGPFGFLAEISAEEIDLLAGHQIGGDCRLELGTVFNITEAFQQIHRNQARKREIETIRATLMGIVNTLDLIGPFIEEPIDRPPDEELPHFRMPIDPTVAERMRAMHESAKPEKKGKS
jgi:hypothetical protein